MGAVLAARDMAAEDRRAAALDGRHDLELAEAQMAGVGAAQRRPWPRRISATSSDGRDKGAPLRRAAYVMASCSSGLLTSPMRLDGDAGVERGRIELLVPEQHLDHADIDLLLEQMGGEAVPQRVQGDALVDRGRLSRGVAGAVELARGERLHRVAARKQPALGPRRLPPGAQQLQQMRGEHHVAILATLALLDPDDHAGAVDVADLERDHLGGAQTRAIGHAQRRPVLEAGRGFQEARHLLRAQNDGQLAGLANEGQALRDLAAPKRHGEEEPQRRHAWRSGSEPRRRWRPDAADSAAGPPRSPGPASDQGRW